MTFAGITIVGLGPGDPGLLTHQAWEILNACTELYVRTSLHPVVQALPPRVVVTSFDHLFASEEAAVGVSDQNTVLNQIVEKLLELGRREQGVVYAVPGHPYLAEVTSSEIVLRAQQAGLPMKLVAGLSMLEPTLSALGINPLPQITIIDALVMAHQYAPLFPPHAPALIVNLSSPALASRVKATLSVLYPEHHPIKVVHAAGTEQELVEDLTLNQFAINLDNGFSISLYVPALGVGTSFEEFLNVVAQLRSPDGCPWDREQTHQSLRTTLLEETYEVLEALDQQDIQGLQEELGDLLLQIYLHAQIAVEAGEFTMADVVQGLYAKILRRHPHVFARIEVEDVADVLVNWERIKAEERAVNGKQARSLLDGVNKILPALNQADQYLKRAARVGFDWPDLQAVSNKLLEELGEVDRALSEEEKLHEIGDLLLAVADLARWKDIDPESALRQANMRFKARFGHIETSAKMQGKSVSDLSLAEMELLWQEAKKLFEG